jgi:hypothetical protein
MIHSRLHQPLYARGIINASAQRAPPVLRVASSFLRFGDSKQEALKRAPSTEFAWGFALQFHLSSTGPGQKDANKTE